MTRIISSKVMWVGRATVYCVGLSVILAMMLGVAGAALAAVPGDPLRLGKINTINRLTALVGSTASSMLIVDNNGSGTALVLRVGSSTTAPADKTAPPMKVDSQARVDNLNADELDGKDSSEFLAANGKAADADTLDGVDSDAFFSGKTYRVRLQVTGPGGGLVRSLFVECDPGDKALGGGADSGAGDDLVSSFPFGDGTWAAEVRDNGDPSILTALAVCADFPPLRPPTV